MKIILVLAFVAVASAEISSFGYQVADPYTGDFKHQYETRAGDRVQGQYGLLESDGTRRTVDYTAGSEGFNALVRKDPAVFAPFAAPFSPAAIASYPYAYGPYTPYVFSRYGAYGYAAPYGYRRFY
ncbi:larval/pupal rigid cuticle protein 66-like [Colias croceus]|uniref:larval/pupal rigid cuticle protein 66-like n=1 Tax=Colias crocea TaxID=72248 RepID=UPI001E27F14E|nr:larval/pupal rigid cuticle protein 66-like [Colias croceus]CAG4943677.1 unnamed protein product [Colias eurytheme]